MFSIVTIDSRGIDTFITNTLDEALAKGLLYISSVVYFETEEQINHCFSTLNTQQNLTITDYKFKIPTERVECIIFENEEITEPPECEKVIEMLISKTPKNLKEKIENLTEELNSLKIELNDISLGILE